MPQRIEKLKSTLEELRRELDRTEGLEPEERSLLASTVSELQQRLDRASPQEVSPQEDEDNSLEERLEELEGRFQVRHPALAGLILRVVDALGQLGI